MSLEEITDKELRAVYRMAEAAFMQAFASLARMCTTPEACIERYEALDWIFASHRDNPWKFDNVSQLLGYDPDVLRDEIIEQCMTAEEKHIWL